MTPQLQQPLRSAWRTLPNHNIHKNAEEQHLLKLGVQQETTRNFAVGHNAGIAVSVMGAPAIITGGLSIAYSSGGPAAAVWGWTCAALLALVVGLCMAEIASGLPSAGGPFFWASWLAGEHHGPIASWLTGWVSLVGQVTAAAGVAGVCMGLASTLSLLSTGAVLTTGQQLGVYTGVLLVSGAVSSLPSRALPKLGAISLLWNIVLPLTLTLLVPMLAPYHQRPKLVWGTFFGSAYSTSGITSDPYLFLQGMLFSCWVLTEETTGAGTSVPTAIILAICVTAATGYFYIIALVFSIQDLATLTTGNAGGNIVAQIFLDVFMARFNSSIGAAICVGFNFIACILCLIGCITAGSRMLWAFAREKGLPASKYFRSVHPATQTPLRTIWLTTAIAFLLGLPMLLSAVAFSSIISCCSISLAVSYGIPFICKVTVAAKTFEKGKFHLGWLSKTISWLAILGLCFNIGACSSYSIASQAGVLYWLWQCSPAAAPHVRVNFSLPAAYPITASTFNYAPVGLAVVVLLSLAAWWFPVWGARHWYEGPRRTYMARQQSQGPSTHASN